MIELLLLIIPVIYQIIFNFLNKRSKLSIFLEKELVDNNIYIITDNLYKKKEKFLFLSIFYYSTCELSRTHNVIDVCNEEDINYLINKIQANSSVTFILDSNSNDNLSLNLLNFLIKKNNIRISSYIPNTTKGSSILLALSSNEIFLNWNSHLSPLKNLTEYNQNNYFIDSPNENQMKSIIDCNDILYLLEKFFISKKDLANKIKKNFLISQCSNIYYDYRDLKKMGLPVIGKIDENIMRIYENFTILKKMN